MIWVRYDSIPITVCVQYGKTCRIKDFQHIDNTTSKNTKILFIQLKNLLPIFSDFFHERNRNMTTNGSDIRTNENPAANYMLKANNKHPKKGTKYAQS